MQVRQIYTLWMKLLFGLTTVADKGAKSIPLKEHRA